ncbi:MAG: response regulator [Phycisphaeraceae bacterium]|nr:response regulator [Phycisphaeraceae bacterium]
MPNSILVIDDDPGIGSALRIRLEASGYSVQIAATGFDGIAQASAMHPDFILLDIRLPDIEGYEVCRRLKSDPAVASIPVVVLSANVQDEAKRQALDAGAELFLSKPYEFGEVQSVIQEVLGTPGAANN